MEKWAERGEFTLERASFFFVFFFLYLNAHYHARCGSTLIHQITTAALRDLLMCKILHSPRCPGPRLSRK